MEVLAKYDLFRATHLTAKHVFIHVPFIILLSWQIYLLFKMATTIPGLEKVVFPQFFRNRPLSNITMSHVIRDVGLGTKPSMRGKNHEVLNNL